MKTVSLITTIIVITTSQSLAVLENDYYWLDYFGGDMPTNALKIQLGRANYVGQVYTKKYELLPATIHTTQPFATFNAYDLALTANTNVKVLCSQFKQNFKWVNTTATTYTSLPDLVVGGSELGNYAYFGRVFKNGEAVLGKLGGALTINVNGKEEYIYDNFQVLVYNKVGVNICECSSVCKGIDKF